uniref:SRCR domain-containing protein n=1 Tax=Heterorhabditis bacteriophora TaxID=37862 RepID=A0A1I7WNL6_HETBA
MSFCQENSTIPCYLYLTTSNDENSSDGSIKLPSSMPLDHPSLEEITIKRVKSVEKGCMFFLLFRLECIHKSIQFLLKQPTIVGSIVFYIDKIKVGSNQITNGILLSTQRLRGLTYLGVFPFMSMTFIRGKIFEENNNFICIFECVQTICQRNGVTNEKPYCMLKKNKISNDGYLIFAYKTMEDMYTEDFAASWKTWTGARLLCQLLPEKYKIKSDNLYIYIYIYKIITVDCAPALNVLHCIKPKVCAFVGAYRSVTFKVDQFLCISLSLKEEQELCAYASSMTIRYCNHTAFAKFSGYIENGNYIDSTGKEKQTKIGTKSKETQTDCTQFIAGTNQRKRRTLPRTISIYDFPSMKYSTASPCKLDSSNFDILRKEDMKINGIDNNENNGPKIDCHPVFTPVHIENPKAFMESELKEYSRSVYRSALSSNLEVGQQKSASVQILDKIIADLIEESLREKDVLTDKLNTPRTMNDLTYSMGVVTL